MEQIEASLLFLDDHPRPIQEVAPILHTNCLARGLLKISALRSPVEPFQSVWLQCPGSERSCAHDGVVVAQRHTSLTRKSSRRPVTGHSKTKAAPSRRLLSVPQSRTQFLFIISNLRRSPCRERAYGRNRRNKVLAKQRGCAYSESCLVDRLWVPIIVCSHQCQSVV